MRRAAAVLLVLLLGCGRVGYDDQATRDGGPDPADAAPVDAAPVDAAPVDAAPVDAAPVDAAPAEDAGDACVPVEEACNGRDDDCDGASDETFTVVAAWDACSTATRGGALTLVTLTFDREDAVRDATVVEGGVEGPGALTTPGAMMLDPARTLGNLISPPATADARWVPLPEVGRDPAFEPNVTRATIEATWTAAWAMRDGPGDDLVVLEHGDPITEPEGFAISVRDARTGLWSRVRYEHFDAYSDADQIFATTYDLADLGLAGGVVDRVRVHNVFGADAAAPDRVTDPSGEGFVVRGGEPGYATAHALTMSAGGTEYPTALLDTDLLFVAALHPTVAPRCCVAP